MNAQKCKHASCTCTATEKDGFCSKACRDAKNVSDLTCQCMHNGCSGTELKA
jgi:hypothetical protein